MRINHLVENLNVGGAERVVIDLVLEQHRRGHDLRVICLFEPGTLASELEEAGISVLPLNKTSGPSLALLIRLRRLLRDDATQVLHTHNAMAHYYGVAASIALDVVRINTRHGMGTLLANRRQRLLYRLSMGFTDAACFVCDAAREQFIADGRVPPARARVVHNGIPESLLQPHPAGALRSLLSLPENARIIITVGRLNPAKNHPLLVRAFLTLAEQQPDLHLVIIGDGAGMATLQQLRAGSDVPARIHLAGARRDVADLLVDADLFVLSSITEGFSIALLEAAAAGIPVIATDVGGNREIVVDGESGRLVPSANDAALVESMGAMLASPERAAIMAKRLHQWVHSHATVASMADAYERLYEEGLA
ncbi:MAG: glycosyltransferase [Alcanivoracaceae bacterium]